MDSVGKLDGWKGACAVFLLCAAAIASPAQTFKTLVTFDGTNGSLPSASLIQGTDGDLYGTTEESGPGPGTVFKITPGGKLTTLHSFDGTDGEYPVGQMVQATNGEFYGTTSQGGAYSYGTVFKITPGGKLTTLHSFGLTDGVFPFAGLIQATNGEFYGTTCFGGANNAGTVFKITSGGTLATLYTFCTQTACTDGSYPRAALIQVFNGDFYGTTWGGGINGGGTIFKITPRGKLATLYNFCAQMNCTDGAGPYAGLVQAPNGDFYGTTMFGGANGDGTVFKITASGVLSTLYSFCAQAMCPDGANPWAGLALGNDRNFYGTTSGGVIIGLQHGDGTVFKITPGGKLTTLHSFDGTDGAGPLGGLIQATSGNFYGTTPIDGAGAWGTLFRLSVGLRPFVETQPTFGKMGALVTILGTDLTGATGVSFNGTAATFKVVSKSEIKTTVPVGATTGKVKVTTPKRTLSSNVAFRITK